MSTEQAAPQQETFFDAVMDDPATTDADKLAWVATAARDYSQRLERVYGLLADLERVSATQPERPEARLSQAVADLIRAALDTPSAPGGTV